MWLVYCTVNTPEATVVYMMFKVWKHFLRLVTSTTQILKGKQKKINWCDKKVKNQICTLPISCKQFSLFKIVSSEVFSVFKKHPYIALSTTIVFLKVESTEKQYCFFFKRTVVISISFVAFLEERVKLQTVLVVIHFTFFNFGWKTISVF